MVAEVIDPPHAVSAQTDLAVVYEHPSWFNPLFAALDRHELDYRGIHIDRHMFDPASTDIPARVIFNRIAMSSFLRESEHPIFYGPDLLERWRSSGARIINGPEAMAIDRSKARQLQLFASLGLAIPATRVVHRAADLAAAAASIGYPVLVKANVGGSGAGIARYDSEAELSQAVAERSTPTSVDQVLLIQDFVPPRDGTIVRIETLAGKFLYAIEVSGVGDSFDLCPADACIARPGATAARMVKANPDQALIDAAEAIVGAAGIDVGGLEVMIDDRDGTPRFYDLNALSNFVADPVDVLGFDPHDRLVDYLKDVVRRTAR